MDTLDEPRAKFRPYSVPWCSTETYSFFPPKNPNTCSTRTPSCTYPLQRAPWPLGSTVAGKPRWWRFCPLARCAGCRTCPDKSVLPTGAGSGKATTPPMTLTFLTGHKRFALAGFSDLVRALRAH
jgi:hypothetical protein